MYLYLKMAAKVDYCVKADLAGKPERETERETRQLDLGSEIRSGIWDLGSDLGEIMALYCPKGSGTLRQQLVMMHGIAGYCMVVHCIE